MSHPTTPAPIGVFDSGYGGLTILSEICRLLPQYDYIYLGMSEEVVCQRRGYEFALRDELDGLGEGFSDLRTQERVVRAA